ncbi:hypothetical protein [Micromonospora sp. IBHARD004]|uniref:hypothetical protein n=1 Tax=Micromonospora sp. IBHARD004 TaxID=3457764 RepID=UPI0040592FCD
MQAAVISLAAVAAAVAVVRAGGRRAVGDATADDLRALQDGAFADAGMDASPLTGALPGRNKETASSAAAAR